LRDVPIVVVGVCLRHDALYVLHCAVVKSTYVQVQYMPLKMKLLFC